MCDVIHGAILAILKPPFANTLSAGDSASNLLYEPCMSTPSLYEQLGGDSGIETLVIAFYVRVMADPELAPFFRHTSVEKLHLMQREFFAMALGGPIHYSGKPISTVHHGRGITPHHFSRFVEHLVETLEELGVDDADAEKVIDRINAFANEVTGTSY
jgi:hemoglobin